MALAKHEVSGGKPKAVAYAPGYGRINMECGALEYQMSNGPMILGNISRRDIADEIRARHANPRNGVAGGIAQRKMVPLAGIEPALLAELDFESSASTNSATGAPTCRRRSYDHGACPNGPPDYSDGARAVNGSRAPSSRRCA